MHAVKNETIPEYVPARKPRSSRAKTTPLSDDQIIDRALAILSARLGSGAVFDSPQAVASFLTVRAGARADQQREVFSVMYLDSQHRHIDTVDLFTGTLTQTSVYPREVVRMALTLGAAAVILTHNHPSGKAEPSRADENLTQTLKAALALVDVRVLDHFITAGGTCRSMAELGLV